MSFYHFYFISVPFDQTGCCKHNMHFHTRWTHFLLLKDRSQKPKMLIYQWFPRNVNISAVHGIAVSSLVYCWDYTDFWRELGFNNMLVLQQRHWPWKVPIKMIVVTFCDSKSLLTKRGYLWETANQWLLWHLNISRILPCPKFSWNSAE